MPLPPKLHDFRAFLFLCWQHLGLPNPTPIQLDIAYHLQYGPRRKILEGFRGVAKSWITSAYVVWRLRMNPQLKFLVTSASKSRSDDFTTFTLRLIKEMPLLQCLTPGFDQRESKLAFDVGPAAPDHSPSVKSVGIFGQLTGTRADEIIGDDVEVLNNSDTQLKRDKLSETVKEFDAIIKPGGRITFLGTPQTETSIYNALGERGYTTFIWPARFPSVEQQAAYEGKLAPFIQEQLDKQGAAIIGTPTDPLRFNDLDLLERETSYGRTGFALQFMLDTRLSDRDRYPLKLSDLVVTDLSPDMAPDKFLWSSAPACAWTDLPCVGLNGDRYQRPGWQSANMSPYQGVLMAVDPSGKGKDETAYAVVATLHGYLFLLDAGGVEGGYEAPVLHRLARLAKSFKVNTMLVEANMGDGMFAALLRPVLSSIHPTSIVEVRHNTQKERRIIDTLEPVLNQHRLVVDKGVVQRDYESTKHLPSAQGLKFQLFYQMSRLTVDRGSLAHDDRLDALAMAVAFWIKAVEQDADRMVQAKKDELLQQELEVFTRQGSVPLDSLILGTCGRIHKALSWLVER